MAVFVLAVCVWQFSFYGDLYNTTEIFLYTINLIMKNYQNGPKSNDRHWINNSTVVLMLGFLRFIKHYTNWYCCDFTIKAKFSIYRQLPV